MRPVNLVESPQQILGCFIHVIPSRIIWEVCRKWGTDKLLLKNIDLVQEQDNTCSREPPRIYHGVEKKQTLHHAVLAAFFQQYLVIFAECYAEDDGRYVFKTVNPFLAFTSLSTDVEHAVARLA